MWHINQFPAVLNPYNVRRVTVGGAITVVATVGECGARSNADVSNGQSLEPSLIEFCVLERVGDVP